MNERAILSPAEQHGTATWMDAYVGEDRDSDGRGKADLLNIAVLRAIVFRQRWLIAAVVALALVAGLVVTMLATPMYQARSTVRIEPYGLMVVETSNVDQGISANQIYDLMATQAEVITSRMLAERVAASLTSKQLDALLGREGDGARPAGMSDRQWDATSRETAVAVLQGSVSAETPTNNWIIGIDYNAPSPVVAADMANAYLDAFVNLDVDSSVENNEYAQTYLADQIQTVRARLQDAELQANAFARSRGLIIQPTATASDDEGGGSSPTLTGTNLGLINERAAKARADRIEAEQRWRTLQGLPTSQLAEVQESPVLQGLITQRATKQAELAELRQRYQDDFPQVVTARSQIAALDAQIERTSADIRAVARSDYLIARGREQALTSELNAITGATLSEQDTQVEYGVLDREAGALRQQLETLLQRYNEVSATANVRSGIVNPLDRAIQPGAPYSPNLFNNMLVALVLGLGLAAVLSLLRELLDDKVRSFEDIEDRIGVPLLGHTPFVKDSEIAEQEGNRFSPLMEAYTSIRSTLDFSLPRSRNVIQLTSSQAGEGKSTTALLLAQLFAQYGRRVLLIDGDLRRPTLAKELGIARPKAGLAEVLLGESELRDAVVAGPVENLDILAVGKLPSNPSEIFASSHLREFIERHRHDYSLIIFDSAPVLGLADAPLLASAVDGTIFVAEANKVQYRQMRAALRRLRRGGGNPLGLILTKYRALEAGQAYDYQYAYYRYDQSA